MEKKEERTRNLNSKESGKRHQTTQSLMLLLTYFKACVKVFGNSFILIHFTKEFYFLFPKTTDGGEMDNQEFTWKHKSYPSDSLEHMKSPVIPNHHHSFGSCRLIQQTYTHTTMNIAQEERLTMVSTEAFLHFLWQDLDHNPIAQTTEPNAIRQEHTEGWGQVVLRVSDAMLNLQGNTICGLFPRLQVYASTKRAQWLAISVSHFLSWF